MSNQNNNESGAKAKRIGQAIGFFKNRLLVRFGLLFLLTLLIAFILSPTLSAPFERYKAGQFTNDTIRAPYDFSFMNTLATEKNREDAFNMAPPVANLDTNLYNKTIIKLQNAFMEMQAIYTQADIIRMVPDQELRKLTKSKRILRKEEAEKEASKYTKAKLIESYPAFETAIGITLGESQKQILEKAKFDEKLITGIKVLLSKAYENPITLGVTEIRLEIVGDPERKDGPGKLVIKDVGLSKERVVTSDFIIQDVNLVQRELAEKAKEILKGITSSSIDLILQIANAHIKPNLILDNNETATRKEAAAQGVIPVYFKFQKNQLIIGEGQEISKETLQVFEYLSNKTRPKHFFNHLFGYAIILYMLILLGFWITDINDKSFVITDSDFIFIAISLTMAVLLFRVWQFIVGGIVDLKPEIPELALILLFPVASVAMLTRFLLSFQVALLQAAIVSILVGILSDLGLMFTTYSFIISLVGTHMVRGATRRGHLIKAGLWTGLASAAGAACLLMLSANSVNIDFALVLISAITGGLVAGFLVIAISPVAEWAFGYLTDITLLELANYENPLLKRIMVKTPGTFNHSISIGTLAEAASDAVGANSMLIRVGALYHDAGKSLHPEFFIENQRGKNPHDSMTPEESAKAIQAHVSDGVELILKHGLGEKIAAFAREHHGTDQIKYFLTKAQKSGQEVDEKYFTYPGPKPRSKETGILMIVDQVEATSRTMPNASEEEYREMVLNTIDRCRTSGQLDDSPLTLSDVAKINDALVQVLTGIYHKRIKYPGQKNIRSRRSLLKLKH